MKFALDSNTDVDNHTDITVNSFSNYCIRRPGVTNITSNGPNVSQTDPTNLVVDFRRNKPTSFRPSLTLELFTASVDTRSPLLDDHPPLVFCHGLAANRLYWRDVALILSGHGLDCCIYDMRGHGENGDDYDVGTCILGHIGLRTHCEDLAKLLAYLRRLHSHNDDPDIAYSHNISSDITDKTQTVEPFQQSQFSSKNANINDINRNCTYGTNGSSSICRRGRWQRRAVVVGHSYGGNVALEMAVTRPDLVCGVACVDGGFIDLQSRYPDFESCVMALSPPPFVGVDSADLRRLVHQKWCRGWPVSGQQAMLANFFLDQHSEDNGKDWSGITSVDTVTSSQGIANIKDGSTPLKRSSHEMKPHLTQFPEPLSSPTSLWVRPRLAYPLHMQLLRDLWAYRPASRYALLGRGQGSIHGHNLILTGKSTQSDGDEPELGSTTPTPLLLVPTGTGGATHFTSNKAAAVSEAVRLVLAGRANGNRGSEQGITASTSSVSESEAVTIVDELMSCFGNGGPMPTPDLSEVFTDIAESKSTLNNQQSGGSVAINDFDGPGVRVRWCAAAGHDVPAQYPELVADILLQACQDGFFLHES